MPSYGLNFIKNWTLKGLKKNQNLLYLQILHLALRYDDFKLIRIVWQTAKLNMNVFVKFTKPSKTAVVHHLDLGYSMPRHITVPFGAEAPSGHVTQARHSVVMILNLSELLVKPLVMAKLNMAYLSSLQNRAKLLLSLLPVSPSLVLRAPGISLYHLVPKHLRATWPSPEQSNLLPEACSPNAPTTDNGTSDEWNVLHPNPATF